MSGKLQPPVEIELEIERVRGPDVRQRVAAILLRMLRTQTDPAADQPGGTPRRGRR